MKIPLFSQDAADFFSSKSNWTGLTMIVVGIAGYMSKSMPPVVAIQSIMGGLALLFVKDAIAKK